tara:strand:+ start:1659 stop:2003 length:345 start_codon:yes stop_codon:yes gene_type:complete
MQLIVWTKDDDVLTATDPSDGSEHTFTTYYKDVVAHCVDDSKSIVLKQANAKNTNSNMTEIYSASGEIELMIGYLDTSNSKIIYNASVPPSKFRVEKFKYTEADGWTTKPTNTK